MEVIFIDGTAGKKIGRATLAPEQLPDVFESQTTVELKGTTWLVDRAEPAEAAQFRATGLLVLTLRRLDRVPARDLLYSLPTICGVLPETGVAGHMPGRFEIQEDDWRQVELVSADLGEVIAAQLRAIREISQEHARRDADGRLIGFR